MGCASRLQVSVSYTDGYSTNVVSYKILSLLIRGHCMKVNINQRGMPMLY